MDDTQLDNFVSAFSSAYYFQGLKSREFLNSLYMEGAEFRMEGTKMAVLGDIVEKHLTVFGKTNFAITSTDGMCLPSGNVVITVLGQLKDENDEKPMGFTHTFVLANINNSWAICRENFRIVVHNF